MVEIVSVSTIFITKNQGRKNICSSTPGGEIYEAGFDDGIEDFEELKDWVKKRRLKEPYFWAPK